ncbi:PREDICTED: serpin H1-like [Poecilia mexicana]|uniref:serpin H1-like n=1 Tax=Poecilia mexicana TaxID=48701 RepID=UPI00072E802F|nr:PREDICTED: serpin H1-like [Poecilia mexicana]
MLCVAACVLRDVVSFRVPLIIYCSFRCLMMVVCSGLWQRELSEESADRRTFLGKKYTKVTMMHRAGRYRFHEDVDNMVQVLEAPLWGGRASLVLLLPFHVENLARLDKLLTPELLSKWLERTAVTGVTLSLPKANISSSLSLQVGAPMLAA